MLKKNILIADDSETTRKIIAVYLKCAGYSTVFAANGVDAVEKLVSANIDIIITDLHMPQMDGIELTTWIRSNDKFRDMPLIILSTVQDDMHRGDGIGAGASAFLTKPVTRERLINEVNKAAGEK